MWLLLRYAKLSSNFTFPSKRCKRLSFVNVCGAVSKIGTNLWTLIEIYQRWAIVAGHSSNFEGIKSLDINPHI